MEINVRINEGCAPQPNLLWDSVWNVDEGVADWALAGASETQNHGGLQALASLETAVMLCLFTDRYCPPTHPLAKYIEASDPRGWWGDGIDVDATLGEAPLGSLLWLLERSVVTDDTIRWAQSLALDALSVMLAQKSVARVDAQAFGSVNPSRIDLAVQLYGVDGVKIYDRRFDNIWSQFRANPGAWALSGPDGDATLSELVGRGGPVDLGSVSLFADIDDDFGSVGDPVSDTIDLGTAP